MTDAAYDQPTNAMPSAMPRNFFGGALAPMELTYANPSSTGYGIIGSYRTPTTATLFQIGYGLDSFYSKVRFQCAVATAGQAVTATVARLWCTPYYGQGTVIDASTQPSAFLGEVALPAFTADQAGIQNNIIEFPLDITIGYGYSMLASIHAVNASWKWSCWVVEGYDRYVQFPYAGG